MSYRHFFRLLCAVCLFSLLFAPSDILARQTRTTFSQSGTPLFLFEIYDAGEEYGDNKLSVLGEASDWTLSGGYLGMLDRASDYWALLLGTAPRNTSPVPITVGTFSIQNANAASLHGGCRPELAQAVLQDVFPQGGRAALIRLGILSVPPYTDDLGPLTILPANGNAWHLTNVLVHELGHAMGISANRTSDGVNFWFPYTQRQALWNTYLADSFGNPAQPSMDIIQGTAARADSFVIDSTGYTDRGGGQAFFQGPNTMEAIGGPGTVLGNPQNYHNIPGVPINGYEHNRNYGIDIPELSHIELRNSMMSHQNYRNWGTFMEAELAIFQDIGIPVDRKNFFGASVYTDNGAHVLNLGFYARNTKGTAYLPGVYNATPLTIGLHLYGTDNTVFARGEVLSSGFGGVGIRVDGWNNNLTLVEDARIRTQGEDAVGLLVAYGKEHAVTLRGEVSANGPGGVGARFDFGDNLMSNLVEYRGSYIRMTGGNNISLLNELQGPLVASFDVTGSLAGNDAAILVAENAFVQAVNIMQGARLSGDIISHWNPDNPMVQRGTLPAAKLTTTLAFGLTPDASGRATALPDPSFFLEYAGNVTGPQSINARLAGGTLAYAGIMHVRSFHANAGTTLLAPIATGVPAEIHAPAITFEAGSAVGAVSGEPFVYGQRLPASYAVLRLKGKTADNQASLTQDNGSFARGFYDYDYTLRWEDGNRRALLAETSSSVSSGRAARSAITAPHAMALQHPHASMVHGRAAERFMGRKNIPAEPLIETASGGGTGSLWITPAYGDSRRHGSGKHAIRTPGLGFGGDAWLNGRIFLGAGVYLARPLYRSSDADIDAETVIGMIYGGALLPLDLELDAFASLGHSRYDQDREVMGERYDKEYSGENYGWGVSLGRALALADETAIRPFTSYEFLRNRVDGYTEKTHGDFGLHVGRSGADLHRMRAGAELVKTLESGNLSAGLFYSGLYGDKKPEARLYFNNDPAQDSITSRGWAADEHSLGASLGFGLGLGEHTDLSANYTFLGGKKNQSHQAELKLAIRF